MALVAFPKSPSKGFPFALSVAQQASRFEVASIAGLQLHVAYFEPTERDAKLVIALLDQISGWKGGLVYSKGHLVRDQWRFVEVLTCYLQSCRCTDPAAHCFVMTDDPKFQPVQSFSMTISFSSEPETTKPAVVDRYVFPCRLLHASMRFQADHPASLQDQIQAAAVHHGCHLCPRFDPSQFKKAGTATYYIDA